MNKEALKLYFSDEKNKRVLDIITSLITGSENVTQLAKKHGISRVAIYDIAKKYQINLDK